MSDTAVLRQTSNATELVPRTGEPFGNTVEADTDQEILFEARHRFQRISDWEGTFRTQFVDDVRFAHGDSDNHWQWPDAMFSDRDAAQRPSLTVNKVRQHCLQVVNDAKQNKPEIRITPVSDEATKASADVFEGVMRHIEYMSNASVAYDTATEHQVQGGIGWWRINTAVEDPDGFEVGLRIQRVRDALSVWADPDIQQVDGSDMTFAFVVDDVPRDQFTAKYPEYRDRVPQASFAGPVIVGGWLDEDHVRVAEYFRLSEREDVLHLLPDGSSIRESEVRGEQTLRDLRRISLRRRHMQSNEVEWFKIVGGEIVDRAVWPGKYIPLVRVIGEEAVIEGRLERKGHVRALKDPQRIYNYWTPLQLHTPLPTPSGWTTMGDVRPGDQLLDEQGRPTTVIGKSPVHLYRNCLRIEFDDGSHIIADAEHPWQVEERGKPIPGGWQWTNRLVTTRELTPKRHFIHMPKPLELPDADLPVHPYLLGMWLGNGTASAGTITNGSQDLDETREHLASLGYRLSPPWMRKGAGTFTVYGVIEQLRQLGLLGNKHIPPVYLRASAKQRWELLQGLMDTDGSVNTRLRTCSFTTTTPALSDGFAELLSSLGLKQIRLQRASRRNLMPGGYYSDCQPHDQFTFTAAPDVPVFRLRRKANVHEQPRNTHWRRTKRFRIKSVVPVPSEPVQCVHVDTPSHLFLCGPSMVPTHNSSGVEAVALQSKTPYVAAAESIEAFQGYWDSANTVNHSVLPYNARDDQGSPLPPPQRQDPPQMPQAYIQGMQIAQMEMMMASGQYAPQMGQPSPNEISGKAIQARQRQGDTATYHFIDNLAIAIRFTGRILLDLIPKVYDTPRVLRILALDGTVGRVQLDPNQPQALQQIQSPNPQAAAMQGAAGPLPPTPIEQMTAQVTRIFNPNVGRYEVQADVGPAYATKRQQAYDAFVQIIATAPQVMNIAGDLLFKAADFPMAEELAERLQRLVPPQALGQGPSPGEQQLSQQLQGSQAHIALLAEKLAVAEMKLKAKDEQKDIDAYEAVSNRLGHLLNAEKTDSPYVDPAEIRLLIAQMVQDALRQPGMAPVSAMAMSDAMQQNAITQGLQGQQPPFAPQAPGGQPPAIPGLANGQLASLSPVRPPLIRPPGGQPFRGVSGGRP